MNPSIHAPFNAGFFPQHVALVSIGDNMLPMGYWTVISKEPFRFLICMGVGNYSLQLLRELGEAAVHFMPWSERARVVRAGYISGREGDKAERLGFNWLPAEQLQHTKLISGAETIYETTVFRELTELASREFVPFVLDVVAIHGISHPQQKHPIIYLSHKDFATLGEQWRYR
ncbi:MAG: flavin reductase [Ardenticatenaceae bacterium]|nr:flavin reductase [Ardenticatenaceae bacterium]